ncbi:MAG: hypothetical protein UZ05_CHB002002169 [Chlorobi bacterium OLB5]|nr:MAG: hypothetical protein UZ05_CHB002002169 [Chlorobi bacterium OLB5]
MQPDTKIDYTNRYADKNSTVGGTACLPPLNCECFICGRHESKTIKLRIIRRWKPVAKAVSLIIDTVCCICDDKYKLISSSPIVKK